MIDKTFVMVKTDAIGRRLLGTVISILEQNGFDVKAIHMFTMLRSEAEKFYEPHAGRPDFHAYNDFMISGPMVAMVLEGDDAMNRARELVGSWNPAKAKPGTIRKDLGVPDARGILNIIHASETAEDMKREVASIDWTRDAFDSAFLAR